MAHPRRELRSNAKTAPRTVLHAAALACALAMAVWAVLPGEAATSAPEGPIGPDVIVGDLHNLRMWGTVGSITSYSVGTTSCNIGDQTLLWEGDNANHPVIGQNMYRLKDGRMEQVGQSWLKHGFTALAQDACNLGCQSPGTGDLLGIGCSDPYSASLNGDQDGFGEGGLGPRSDVNPVTGVFPFPYTAQGQSGDAIYKRLQVHNDDVTPAMNVGARYFVEGHYIAADDAASGNDRNNASYREITVANNLDISFTGPTVQTKPAIVAWQDIDPTVEVVDIDVPGEGHFKVANKVTDLGGGMWRYDYAVLNLNSARAAHSFTVPVAAGVTVSNLFFRDVDSHSGEPYALTDWVSTVGASSVTWQTDDAATDPNANAIRWGTMYNFGFEANDAPEAVNAVLGLFVAGSPGSMTAAVRAPGNTSLFRDGFESGDTMQWSDSASRY